jgi:hypothetical protein
MRDVTVVLEHGEIVVHMADDGEYVMCGVLIEDVGQNNPPKIITPPNGSRMKIDCPLCIDLWQRVRQYRKSDFVIEQEVTE